MRIWFRIHHDYEFRMIPSQHAANTSSLPTPPSAQKDSDEVRWKYENFMGRTESVMWVDDGKRTIDHARFDTSNGTWHVSRTPGEPLQTTNRKLPAVTTHIRHFTDYRCKIIVTHFINHDNIILKKAWYHSKTLKQLPPPPDGPCDVPPCGVNAAVSAGGAGAGDAGATKLTGKVFDNVYGASTRVVEVSPFFTGISRDIVSGPLRADLSTRQRLTPPQPTHPTPSSPRFLLHGTRTHRRPTRGASSRCGARTTWPMLLEYTATATSTR